MLSPELQSNRYWEHVAANYVLAINWSRAFEGQQSSNQAQFQNFDPSCKCFNMQQLSDYPFIHAGVTTPSHIKVQYLWKWPPTSTWTLALTHHLPHQELPVHCQYLWSDVAIPENKRSVQWIFLFRHIMDPLVVHCRPTEAFYKPVSRARVSPSLPWCPSEASLLPQSDSARAHLEDNQLPCCVVTRTPGRTELISSVNFDLYVAVNCRGAP